MIGDDDRPLSTAHGPRFLAEEKDLEAVGQRTEQFQRAEDVEQLEAIEKYDADARVSSMVTVARLLVHADAMDDAASPSVITVFRSRLRADAAANGYAELAARMESRARAMAGFIDFKTFTATDGERVSIITFDTWDHHRAWRDDPEHRAAQRRGPQDFYSDYSIFVCEERHHHDFRLP